MTVSEYEFIAQAEVLAEGVAQVLAVLNDNPWLNFQTEDGEQHGKIVYLFPAQRHTRVVGWGLIGPIFPLLRTEGEAFERYFLRTYGLVLIIRLVAQNQQDAVNYVQNRGWINQDQGVTVRVASSPVPSGTYGPELVGGLAESERMF